MKNKKLLYVLFPLVFIVWGLVVYKLFFNKRHTDEPTRFNISQAVADTGITADTFSIIAHYRDPFLGRHISFGTTNSGFSTSNSSARSVKKKEEPKVITQVINWPVIRYGGIVQSLKNNTGIGLVSVNAKDYLVRNGDNIQNLTIKSVTPDSVIIIFEKMQKSFIKKQY